MLKQDEAPRRDTSFESLAKLKPAFGKEGTITAGNAPGVNDGACALVLMNEEKAKKEGKEPLHTLLAMQKWQLNRKTSHKHLDLSLMNYLKKQVKH